MNFRIRDLRYEDLAQAIELQAKYFVEELTAAGVTPEQYRRRIRLMAWGRMIPFRLLMALARKRWGALAAEVEGRVVGMALHFGDQQIQELSNIVVMPEFRRQGIATALTAERLRRLARIGCTTAYAVVYQGNEASLGSLRKHSFQTVYTSTEYDLALPLREGEYRSDHRITSRPLRSSDRPIIRDLTQRVFDPIVLEVLGPPESSFFRSPAWRVYERWMGRHHWLRVFERAGQPIGFAQAIIQRDATKGWLLQPLVLPADKDVLNAIYCEAAKWMSSHGVAVMRVTAPGENVDHIQDANVTYILMKRIEGAT